MEQIDCRSESDIVRLRRTRLRCTLTPGCDPLRGSYLGFITLRLSEPFDLYEVHRPRRNNTIGHAIATPSPTPQQHHRPRYCNTIGHAIATPSPTLLQHHRPRCTTPSPTLQQHHRPRCSNTIAHAIATPSPTDGYSLHHCHRDHTSHLGQEASKTRQARRAWM